MLRPAEVAAVDIFVLCTNARKQSTPLDKVTDAVNSLASVKRLDEDALIELRQIRQDMKEDKAYRDALINMKFFTNKRKIAEAQEDYAAHKLKLVKTSMNASSEEIDEACDIIKF
jgi:hypothetical protein